MSRKNRNLKLVHKSVQESSPPNREYGWKPGDHRNQKVYHAYDSWLISQAQSYLRRQDVTIKEARELFSHIDITTRQPIQEAKAPGWWERLLEQLS